MIVRRSTPAAILLRRRKSKVLIGRHTRALVSHHHQSSSFIIQHPLARQELIHGLNGGSVRGFAGKSFFDQLRESFQKEFEQNKEFKESLSKLKKETGDITGKAQEQSSKLSENVSKYTSGISSKLSQTSETVSRSSQAAYESFSSAFSQLKQKVAESTTASAKANEKEEKPKAKKETRSSDSHQAKATSASKVGEEEGKDKASSSSSAANESATAQAKGEETASFSSISSSAAAGAEGSDGKTDSKQQQQEGEKGGASSSSSSTNEESTQSPPPPDTSTFFSRLLGGRPPQEAAVVWAKDFKEGVREAWIDLFGMKEQSTGMRKHIYQRPEGGAASKEEEDEEEVVVDTKAGGGALVVVKKPQKAWERMAEQLKNAPIIQEILKAGTKLADTELGRQAGKLRNKLHDRVEDAREMWETSQNPIVYKLSSVWDDLTGETELGMALREIRRADPEFVLEDWTRTLSEAFLPLFFEAYLKGDLKTLKPYLTEGMYKALAEEFRMRKSEGLVLDPNVLEIMNAEIIQAKMHDHQPVLVVGTLVQHINCVRNREGSIVEGKEDEVRASFYLLLFMREFNEKEGALEWKISERYLGFSQPYV